jgi:hypothetical protein
MILFALYVIIDRSYVAFLVHVACQGVDATLAHTGSRYPLWNEREEPLFVLYAAAAVGAVVAGAALLGRAVGWPSRRRALNWNMIALGAALLGAAASYNWWYYRYAFADISPDLAEAHPGANWWQSLGGVILASIVLTAGAARLAKSAAAQTTQIEAVRLDLPAAVELLPVMLLMFGACSVSLVQTTYSVAGPSTGLGWDGLRYLLV